jgi:hypothetical protein
MRFSLFAWLYRCVLAGTGRERNNLHARGKRRPPAHRAALEDLEGRRLLATYVVDSVEAPEPNFNIPFSFLVRRTE